jgi:hypothetical protein
MRSRVHTTDSIELQYSITSCSTTIIAIGPNRDDHLSWMNSRFTEILVYLLEIILWNANYYFMSYLEPCLSLTAHVLLLPLQQFSSCD